MKFTLPELQTLWHMLTSEQKKLDRLVAKHDQSKNLVARDMANYELRQITEIKTKVGNHYQNLSKDEK